MKLKRLKIIAGNHIVSIVFSRIVKEYGGFDLFINDEFISSLSCDIVYNVDRREYYLESQAKDWFEIHKREGIENV